MGWQNEFQTVITLPTGATTGARVVIDGQRDAIFVYDSTNHLIASMAASSGTDAAGNNYVEGFACYYATGQVFFNTQPTFLTVTGIGGGGGIGFASGYNGGVAAFMSAGLAGVAGTAYQVPTNPSGAIVAWMMSNIYAIQPGGSTQETWHNLALNAGFQQLAGFGVPRYQYENINGGRVRLAGAIALTANEPQSTAFANLPVGYRPLTVPRYFLTANNLSGGAGQTESLHVQPGGNLEIGHAGSTGNYLFLDGITFELD